jgi:hypothetical protein
MLHAMEEEFEMPNAEEGKRETPLVLSFLDSRNGNTASAYAEFICWSGPVGPGLDSRRTEFENWP